ncbi:helix-turn-helix transcriptional regulator [Rhodococcus sp. TAF43]|jgi:proteasome accessory factor C|uniref:helix-turn-helix transcriptional regulator n=1 Tax=unclassified Rhodococcus (in: high G+C Gram-positive bacteria) TaxID=192944 RepID=UPI000E0B75E6|nr:MULTISPECIES: YafY family protein [unclassified Rhodococcus (in: high G+C Gram-positive bacteria)]QKT11553.1 YafY family transcriptional regulator [Rhodococcus sp. W8901]RDI19980.1 proteasome accessory factor C [Rhodococcus sp. AG1013]
MSTRLSRLTRLLNLVPYFMAHPGISKEQAARELGVTVPNLMKDLDQLWVCGLPGYGPGDLIDLSFDEDTVSVIFSAGIDRPLRLTSTEATVLLVALRSLAELPGMVDPSAAQGAIAKIESAAGSAARGRSLTDDGPEGDGATENPVAAVVRTALQNDHALHLTYYSASRDAVSERVVDPIRSLLVDDHTYLQAWCRQAEGVRLFRFDRIDAAEELDEPSAAPEQALGTDEHLELFSDDADLPLAVLQVSADQGWILDNYPMVPVRTLPDGSVEATMRYGSQEWMARLVLGFGSGAKVLEPPQLVEAVRERAWSALGMYDAMEA